MEAINFISKGINKNMIVEYSPLLDEAIENFKDYGVLRFIGSKVFVLQCASDFFRQIAMRGATIQDTTILSAPRNVKPDITSRIWPK